MCSSAFTNNLNLDTKTTPAKITLKTSNLNNTFLTGEDNIEASISTPDGKETNDGIMISGKKIKITRPKEIGFKPGHYI